MLAFTRILEWPFMGKAMLFKFRLPIYLAAVSYGFFYSYDVAAQDQDDSDRYLDTIVVTAIKREASLEDVPIAISVLSGERLEAAGLADIKNLPALTPSFMISGSNSETGGATLRIRGVGTSGNNVGLEGAVGVFVDGVYLSRPGVALTELIDLEQIEILRGPQGTLFGRNTSAGALIIKTNKPSLTDVKAFSNLTVGNENLVSLQAGVNFPLIKNELGLNISGAIRDRDGFFTSTLGAESQVRDRALIRAQLLYEPTDQIQLRVIADYSEDNSQCCAPVHIQSSDIGPFFTLAGLPENGGAPAVGPEAIRTYTTNGGGVSDATEQVGVSATLNLNFDIGEVTYIGSWRNYDGSIVQDADFVNLDVFGTPIDSDDFPSNDNINLVTHEVDFAGISLSGRLDWLLGIYHSEEDIESHQSLELGADYQAYAGAVLLTIPGIFEIFGPNPLQVFADGISADGTRANNFFTQKGTSTSLYTHNIFKYSDRLNFSLGARYNRETKEGRFEQINVESPGCNVVLNNIVAQEIPAGLVGVVSALSCFPFTTEADLALSSAFPTTRTFDDVFRDEEFTYTLGANYSFTPNIISYFNYSKGFKSGGFNLDATAAILNNPIEVASGSAPQFSDPRFDSEKVEAYEIGLKTKFNNNRGQVNLTAFHQDIEDFQVLEFTGIQFETFNVPIVKSTGVEIEGEFLIREGLTLFPALAWTDARYPDNCDLGISSQVNISNLCGERLANAPEWVFTLGWDYKRNIPKTGLKGFISGDIRYESTRRTSTQATEIESDVRLTDSLQNGHAKLDLRAGILSKNGHWSAEIWGRNITDQRTQTLTFDVPINPGNRAAFFEPPATYGATLRYRY